MSSLFALASGLVFGLGLIASGMTQPTKVKAFLDVYGLWDPSLALVMGGAIAVASLAFALARRRRTAWNGDPLQIPTNTTIDARLIGGGVLFGIGWGLAGFCPGPALVAASSGWVEAWIFTGAMLIGMGVHDWATKATVTHASPSPHSAPTHPPAAGTDPLQDSSYGVLDVV